MKGKRDSNLVQQIFNQDSYEKYIKDICGIVNAIFKWTGEQVCGKMEENNEKA